MDSERCGIVARDPDRLGTIAFMSEVACADGSGYEPWAVTPVPEYQPLLRRELTSFLATDTTPDNGCIELVSFTPRLREYLIEHKDREILPTECPPHELTTTHNTENHNLKPGLHLDNKENRPLSGRLQSERRIGLNLGPGNRWLLVGSLEAGELSQSLGYGEDHVPVTPDVRDYVKLSEDRELPPLRCLWLLLEPGQGYIAPTENIVHDGSTHNIQEPSTIRFWIGAPERGYLGSVV